VIMLRSQGIPSRMSAGFVQGEYDNASNRFVVRERDAHTWVEAYFPGYGWIEFEPTAAQAPINRGDEQPPPPEQADDPTAAPSPTPSPTETFTPTPTEAIGTVPPQPESNELPTVTPSFTPSPTASPVLVLTTPPPDRLQPQGPLEALLPALGIVALVIFLLLVLVAIGIFIFWWWEWRGMKGLSPITRAWARLERYLGLVGLHLNSDETPNERRRKIVRVLPRQAEPPVRTIARLYTAERYGPNLHDANPVESAANSQVADRAWKDTRGNIVRRFLRRFNPFARKTD